MPTERRSAPSPLAAGLLLEAPREPARAGLPACSRPAFTDPPADRLQSLRGFCHLKGRDQPFEAQLQTARVSFGEQLRITFVGPRRIAHDGTSGSRLSRKNPPSRGRRLSGERVKRVHEAALVYPLALSHSVLLCVARRRGNWLANSLRSLQPQKGPKLPVRFSM